MALQSSLALDEEPEEEARSALLDSTALARLLHSTARLRVSDVVTPEEAGRLVAEVTQAEWALAKATSVLKKAEVAAKRAAARSPTQRAKGAANKLMTRTSMW